MRKKFLLAGVFLLFCFFQTMAQQKTITGKVTSPDGKPLADATVLVSGEKTGVTTKQDGTFSIKVPDKAKTLEVSFVGYATQSVDIATSSNVNVSLAYSAANLSDVVIVGYGTTRKRDLTGALVSVEAKDFNQGVISSPDQLLVGKVAGLQITDNSGQPGSVATIKIRGNNTIRAGGNPLYVVDGVPLDGRSARPSLTLGTGGFGVTPDVNPLLFINPNDIANMTVLKDASATAIYGSRGANGVIVITTKTGGSGKTKLEFNADFSTPAGYMKKFDILNTSQFRSALQKYHLDTLTNSLDQGSSVDALDAVVNNSLSQNYSLAMSGGNETGKFRASFLYSKQNGFIKTTGLDKYIGTFSGQYKFIDNKLTIGFDLIGAHTTDRAALISSTAGSQGNLISSALSWNPTSSFTDASGKYIYPANGSGNPLALLAATSDISNTNTFLGNISASYKILPHLEYKFLYAVNHSAGQRNTNVDGYLIGYPGISGQGYGAVSDQTITSQTIDHTLTYKSDFSDKFHFEGLLGYEYWKSDFSNSSFSATGFNTNLDQMNQIPILYTSIMTDGKTQNPPSTYVDPTTELQSYFARVNLSYSEKFFLTATMRADGSTKFGKNNKYGYFPSVGAKWLISNEDFMKDNNSIFSTLAIRGSWGITGNQDFPAGAAQEQFNFSAYNSVGQVNVANPDLKWESTTSYDFGLDYALLNGRLYGSIDYYNKNTTDILFQSTAIQPAPSSIYYINIPGNLMNTGAEFSINGDIIQKTNFSLSVGFNIAFNKNVLKNFYAPGTKNSLSILTGQITGQGVSNTFGQIITNDQPVDEFWLKPFGGFDANGNQIVGANPQFAGDPNPHTIYGLNIGLTYKKFNVAINGSGAGGYVIYNNTATTITNIAGIKGGRNIDENAYNSDEGTSSGVAASDRFLESGNFFKLRNATIRYSIGNVTKYIKNLNVYVSGTNLFVITKFSGFDPEVNVDKSSNGYPSRSIEYVPYPTPRLISFGVNFSL